MKFGLIGYPLSHSFSKKYFTEKFSELGLHGFTYQLLSIPVEEEINNLLRSDFFGLNITIPYKQVIINYLNDIDPEAMRIGAVNTIVKSGHYSWKGFNTDVHGFNASLLDWYGKENLPPKALVLGSGGSARAVCYTLQQHQVQASIVSRSGLGPYSYEDLTMDIIQDHLLIVNTTPLGMMPEVEMCPAIPYEFMTPRHRVYDLVYNPVNTLFLRRSADFGALTKNGLDMLYAQADHAWTIWKQYGKF